MADAFASANPMSITGGMLLRCGFENNEDRGIFFRKVKKFVSDDDEEEHKIC
jgi:hypothetical protein